MHMAGGRFPSRQPLSANYYYRAETAQEFFPLVLQDGEDLLSLIVSAKDGSLPRSHPKRLKDELCQSVTQPHAIETVVLTRQGKLIITTKSILVAQEILNTQSFLDVPVDTFIQTETISSRFLLRNIDTTIECAEISAELAEQGLHVLEARRFLRKTPDGLTPTPSVLVTVIGTRLPSHIKLWYQNHRVSLFYDRPRQCTTCFKFNHSTNACRSQQLCSSCATTHVGECTSPTLKCANCTQPHVATDTSCSHYQREARLQKFRSENHLTLGEARKRFADHDPENGRTYSRVVSSTPPTGTTSISHTDLNSALQILSSHLTETIQALFMEFQRSITELVKTISQPIAALNQFVQTNKPFQPATFEGEELPAKQTKKARFTSTQSDSHPSMETEPSPENNPHTSATSSVNKMDAPTASIPSGQNTFSSKYYFGANEIRFI